MSKMIADPRSKNAIVGLVVRSLRQYTRADCARIVVCVCASGELAFGTGSGKVLFFRSMARPKPLNHVGLMGPHGPRGSGLERSGAHGSRLAHSAPKKAELRERKKTSACMR